MNKLSQNPIKLDLYKYESFDLFSNSITYTHIILCETIYDRCEIKVLDSGKKIFLENIVQNYDIFVPKLFQAISDSDVSRKNSIKDLINYIINIFRFNRKFNIKTLILCQFHIEQPDLFLFSEWKEIINEWNKCSWKFNIKSDHLLEGEPTSLSISNLIRSML
jgi:hypothetical protein